MKSEHDWSSEDLTKPSVNIYLRVISNMFGVTYIVLDPTRTVNTRVSHYKIESILRLFIGKGRYIILLNLKLTTVLSKLNYSYFLRMITFFRKFSLKPATFNLIPDCVC